jgi:hypothetical protein
LSEVSSLAATLSAIGREFLMEEGDGGIFWA